MTFNRERGKKHYLTVVLKVNIAFVQTVPTAL